MNLRRGTLGLLALGAVGWLILFISIAGGCDRTRTVTEAVTETIVETTTVTETTTATDSSTDTTPTETSSTDSGAVDTSQDSVTLAVLDSNGKNDAVEDVGRVLDFTVQSAADAYLYVKDRPAGGSTCAPTYGADSGNEIVSAETVAAGSNDIRQTVNWSNAGRYLFCMWIATSSDDPNSQVFSQAVKFRPPRASIAFGHPSRVAVNQAATLRFYGSSEAPRALFVKERAAGGAGCAPTYDSDSGNELIRAKSVNGGYNETYVRTFDKAGTYLYCVWLADSSADTRSVARASYVLRVS
jgi:hypothetical protein